MAVKHAFLAHREVLLLGSGHSIIFKVKRRNRINILTLNKCNVLFQVYLENKQINKRFVTSTHTRSVGLLDSQAVKTHPCARLSHPNLLIYPTLENRLWWEVFCINEKPEDAVGIFKSCFYRGSEISKLLERCCGR